MPFPRREDITALDVAQRWLAGEAILRIASDLDTSSETIGRRLKEARREYPQLPWESRRVNPVGTTKEYTTMKDGKPGSVSVRPGSVIHGRGNRLA